MRYNGLFGYPICPDGYEYVTGYQMNGDTHEGYCRKQRKKNSDAYDLEKELEFRSLRITQDITDSLE